MTERLPLPITLVRREDHDPEKLFAAHRQMVLRTAWRLLGNPEDAHDAAQEVCMRLLEHFSSVGIDPKAWLYRVTVNVCNDFYRRPRFAALEKASEAADSAPDPERQLSMKQRRRLVIEGLACLAPRERACIVLRDIEGLPTARVAAILNVEEVTVRGQIHSARLKLARYVRRFK